MIFERTTISALCSSGYIYFGCLYTLGVPAWSRSLLETRPERSDSSLHCDPAWASTAIKGMNWGSRNREPQEYSMNMITYLGPCIPVVFLLYAWASLFGVESLV